MTSGANMIDHFLEDNQLVLRLANQPAIPIFPESKTMFFLKVVDAQLEFGKDDAQEGPAGVDLSIRRPQPLRSTRLDDAQAKLVVDAAAAFDKRFKDQTPAPGSMAALRKMIVDLQNGKPDYDQMSSGLADLTRQQLPQLQATVAKLGAMQSMVFKAVGPAASDIYTVKFENGALEYRIWLGTGMGRSRTQTFTLSCRGSDRREPDGRKCRKSIR